MTTLLHFLLQRKVFANVLMALLIIGGLISGLTIKQELFPPQIPHQVEIEVGLEGASPEEINGSILLVIENGLRGLDGIKKVRSEAFEGVGTVTVTLQDSADQQQMLGEIKNAVDRIETLPQESDRPVVSTPSQEEKALSIIVYGDQPLAWLIQTAQSIRDDLRAGSGDREGLKRVELAFGRNQEIGIEVSEETLRQYGITLEEIAETIQQNSPDSPVGTLFGKETDVVLRMSEGRKRAEDFGGITITETSSGIPLKLADIADISDTFGDATIECWFNGLRAIQIDVFAAGDETPVSLEKAVKSYLENVAAEQFSSVGLKIFENQAAAYKSRVASLLDNALLGLVLVIIILGLFLSPHVAFWVMAGIPTSLLGGLLLLPLFGGSVNMISLFAFIVTIGVVVDDAIMIGEAIYRQRQQGLTPLDAAVNGLREMGGPVLLATCTTIIAFMPMFFIPGEMGVLFYQIPAVVTAVLLVSLLESLFILSAHISTDHKERRWLQILGRPQRLVNEKLEYFIQNRFRSFLHECLKTPLLLIGTALSVLLFTALAVTGGVLHFSFTPTIQSDTVIAQATLPYGTPREDSVDLAQNLVEAANRVLEDNDMSSPGIFSLIGTRLDEGEVEIESLAGSHYISVLMALPPEKERKLTGREFAALWLEEFGMAEELEALNITGETNVTGGEPVELEVFHKDPQIAEAAAVSLGERMRVVAGLSSVDDGVRVGKPELGFSLKEFAPQLGVTAEEVARQIRHRYYGAESFRFIRDGNETRVMVKLPEGERKSISGLKDIHLLNSSGKLVPLDVVVDIRQSRSFTSFVRRDGKRIYPVTADIGFGISDDTIEDILEDVIVPQVMAEFPGVSITFGGEEEENDEALVFLGYGFVVVIGVIYLLLAFLYNSYLQPLLILVTIPFSCIGAVWGHILLGYDMSIVSVMGIIAMAGVVVNDSIVLLTTYNRYQDNGRVSQQAILDAACNRFRPIFLTSLTTFFGLVPLLLETSEQAQFLIPAAISISFGLLFGTIVTLMYVPGLLQVVAGDSLPDEVYTVNDAKSVNQAS